MKFSLITWGVILITLFYSCSEESKFRYEEGVAWNTLYHITYKSDKDLTDSIIGIFKEIDSSLSPFNNNSTVSKINSNSDNKIDSHFQKVYNESLKINRESDGSFDPTLGPVIKAWGFGIGHEITSDTLRLDSLLQLVGINKTKIENNRLIKQNPLIEFNFSALAKGYGVDCIALMLERNGVVDYLVEVGGEIRASGLNPNNKKWTIGIDKPDPDAKQGETTFSIQLDNGGLATSGNYRNYHKTNGKTFGHSISTKTGKPALSDVISATVAATSCMEADALATTCMVIGSEAALNLCTKLRAGVMLIKTDGSIIMNPAFKALAD